MKKKIVILGASSKTGEAVYSLLSKVKNNELFVFTRTVEFKEIYNDAVIIPISPLDITDFKKEIFGIQPDVIINTIGLNDIVPNEKNRSLAWHLNVNVVENIVNTIKLIEGKLIQISSDKVFDGKNGPYTEIDKPQPRTYFGKTKLAAENVIISNISDYAIIRVSLIFGKSNFAKPDFVNNIISKNDKREEIKLSGNLFHNPIITNDLAAVIEKIIRKNKTGIYNTGSSDIISVFDFAQDIADVFSLDQSLIRPIESEEKHGLNYGLINLKAETDLAFKFSGTKEELRTYKLMKNGNQTIIF